MSKRHKPKPIERWSRRRLLRHIEFLNEIYEVRGAWVGAARAEAAYWREQCMEMIRAKGKV